MTQEFIPYEQAFALKELGFDEPCFGYYVELKNPQEGLLKIGLDNDFLQAPTFSQAFRWFREKYNIFPNISYVGKFMNTFEILNEKGDDYNSGEIFHYYNTYKEAELACLIKLIEIVKTK
jgi:hypothetical protein